MSDWAGMQGRWDTHRVIAERPCLLNSYALHRPLVTPGTSPLLGFVRASVCSELTSANVKARLLSASARAQGPSADDLRACLRMPLDAAAARLGCRPSALIRACRCARAPGASGETLPDLMLPLKASGMHDGGPCSHEGDALRDILRVPTDAAALKAHSALVVSFETKWLFGSKARTGAGKGRSQTISALCATVVLRAQAVRHGLPTLGAAHMLSERARAVARARRRPRRSRLARLYPAAAAGCAGRERP